MRVFFVCLVSLAMACGPAKSPTEGHKAQKSSPAKATQTKVSKAAGASKTSKAAPSKQTASGASTAKSTFTPRATPTDLFELRIVAKGKTDVKRPSWDGSKSYDLEETVWVNNGHIKSLKAAPDAKGRTGIGVELSPEGAALLKKATGENLKRKLAIIVGGKVTSVPVIVDAIDGGRLRVSGDNDAQTDAMLKVLSAP